MQYRPFAMTFNGCTAILWNSADGKMCYIMIRDKSGQRVYFHPSVS